MLNVHSLPLEPERPAPADRTSNSSLLTIRLAAGQCALPRLANLMAKLDIEPRWMQVEKSACGSALDVAIDLGGDAADLERLSVRLRGMVTVLATASGSTA